MACCIIEVGQSPHELRKLGKKLRVLAAVQIVQSGFDFAWATWTKRLIDQFELV